LAQYARAKLLDMALLLRFGLSEVTIGGKPAVRVPYKDSAGKECAVRFRLRMKGKRFRWQTGDHLCLYGLWRTQQMRGAGYVVLVEGESDVHTLWSQNFPALGLPGANSWREPWAAHLAGIPKIYVVIEPDKGGEAVLKGFARSTIRNRVRIVRLNGAKDPSELYLKDPRHFKKNFRAALQAALPWSELQQPEEEDDADANDSTGRNSQASQLIAIADSAHFFRSNDDKPYAVIPVNGH